uniref:Uncharacterized protein n=1 Tax=Avena sativa TaxID=4498 RepID=A0ACD5X681_AVESA
MADAAAGKAQVAREVCAASSVFASCPHRRRSPRRPHFVDWYLVLAIGEAASEEAIKRRYRHLALQLHPDKNRHPKAEVAFKLVSEAQACLTDKARRRAFDAERSTAFCAACHARLTTTAARHRTSGDKRKSTPASAPSAHQHHQQRRRPTTTQALREVQNRLRDECRIIDDCLRANNGDVARRRRRRQSFPLFDPSDPHCFPDYPHARPPPPVAPFARCQPSDEELGMGQDQRWCRGGSCCESPVFQVKTAPERAERTRSPW